MVPVLVVSAVNGKAVKEVATRAVVKTGVMLGANVAAFAVNNAMLNKMSDEDKKDPEKMKKFRRNSLIRSSFIIGCTVAVADTALATSFVTSDDVSSEIA